MDSLWTWGGEDFGFVAATTYARTTTARWQVPRRRASSAANGRTFGEVKGDRLLTKMSRKGATRSSFSPRGNPHRPASSM